MVSILLQAMLDMLGYEAVGPAARVGQALEMIGAEAIDAAVLDVNLHGQLSYPVADALIARGVPFVFATGYDRGRLATAYRGFPFLQKPFHTSELDEALATMLAHKGQGFLAPPEVAEESADGGFVQPTMGT